MKTFPLSLTSEGETPGLHVASVGYLSGCPALPVSRHDFAYRAGLRMDGESAAAPVMESGAAANLRRLDRLILASCLSFTLSVFLTLFSHAL